MGLPTPVPGTGTVPGAGGAHGGIVAAVDPDGVVVVVADDGVLPIPGVVLPVVPFVVVPVRAPVDPVDPEGVLGVVLLEVPAVPTGGGVVPTGGGEVGAPAGGGLLVDADPVVPTAPGLGFEPRGGGVVVPGGVVALPIVPGPVLGVVTTPAEFPAGTQGTTVVFGPTFPG